MILAATSGAVNVRLGGGSAPGLTPGPRQDLHRRRLAASRPTPRARRPGPTPQLGHLRSVVGLVWRSVVLWMVLLALLSLAHLVG